MTLAPWMIDELMRQQEEASQEENVLRVPAYEYRDPPAETKEEIDKEIEKLVGDSSEVVS